MQRVNKKARELPVEGGNCCCSGHSEHSFQSLVRSLPLRVKTSVQLREKGKRYNTTTRRSKTINITSTYAHINWPI